MNLTVFLDLDDSIFQTRRKCPAGAPLFPAAVDRDGNPNSWMTQRQRALFDLFQAAGTIVPTTARSYSAFRRVTLPFQGPAILDFGGVVLLPNGEIDEDWDSRIRSRAIQTEGRLMQVLDDIRDFCEQRAPGVYARVIRDFEMPLYLVLKHNAADNRSLQTVAESGILPRGKDWFLHLNDNNLSLVPRFLGKEKAVRYVMDHHLGQEPSLTLGLGDSISDAGFLELCDHAIVPRGSQLQRALFAAKPDANMRPESD
jgi:hypothetical protein